MFILTRRVCFGLGFAEGEGLGSLCCGNGLLLFAEIGWWTLMVVSFGTEYVLVMRFV